MFLSLLRKPLCCSRYLRTNRFALCQRFMCLLDKQDISVELLSGRSLLRVSGNDASTFLQGMITNDIRHLEQGARCMYSMFLNMKGRVLYDAIIYRLDEPNVFFIECDKEATSPLQKHLKLYRVRKRIDIDVVDDEYKVWVAFNPKTQNSKTSLGNPLMFVGQVLCSPKSNLSADDVSVGTLKDTLDVLVCRDPRLSLLGVRVVAPSDNDITEALRKEADLSQDAPSYRVLRYKLGVGEGISDLPPAKCFPLEVNCDYLHGVSFHKGCYLGQELTARTHHTGVVRKRLMPLLFSSPPSKSEVISVENETGKPIGKMIGVASNVGLGLLRISEALQASTLKVSDVPVTTQKPHWWPKEAPKERMSPR